MTLPQEWQETSDWLDEIAADIAFETPKRCSATVEGDLVIMTMVMDHDQAQSILNWTERYDDHECEDGWQAILAFNTECMDAITAASAQTGEIVGDRCDDNEENA